MSRKKVDKKSTEKPPEKPPEVVLGPLVPQKHGGALWQGRGPNPFRGGGRPKNELRKALSRIAEDAMPMLVDIIDGQTVKRVKVPLASVLRHARCAHCDGELRALRPDQVMMVEIEGVESASPSDRIKATSLALQFGVGVERGYDEALVGKLAQVTREFVLDAQVEDLHAAWVRVIGDHIRGVNSSNGGGE